MIVTNRIYAKQGKLVYVVLAYWNYDDANETVEHIILPFILVYISINPSDEHNWYFDLLYSQLRYL